MTSSQGDPTLITRWRQQSVWSKAANKAKSDIAHARTRALVLTTAAAVLSTASAQLSHVNAPSARALAILAAIALALAPFAGRQAIAEDIRDWTRARSVSEALKTEIYMYLAGVHPYRGEHRRQKLQDRIERIVDEEPNLKRLTAGIEPDDRPLPEVDGVASYIELRLNGQITSYYRPKAADYRKRVDRLRQAEVGLTAFAAVLAAVAGFVPRAGLSAWVAVLTTIAAAVAAHAAAQRYEYQQIEFARTADQLETLRSRYEIGSHDEHADDKFVDDCERVISIQNEGWMAKLVSDDDRS